MIFFCLRPYKVAPGRCKIHYSLVCSVHYRGFKNFYWHILNSSFRIFFLMLLFDLPTLRWRFFKRAKSMALVFSGIYSCRDSRFWQINFLYSAALDLPVDFILRALYIYSSNFEKLYFLLSFFSISNNNFLFPFAQIDYTCCSIFGFIAHKLWVCHWLNHSTLML